MTLHHMTTWNGHLDLDQCTSTKQQQIKQTAKKDNINI